jgi:L-lactate permease
MWDATNRRTRGASSRGVSRGGLDAYIRAGLYTGSGQLGALDALAVIPIAVLFILLAVLRVAAHWSSLASLALALIIAVAVYGMPVSLALNSTIAGAAFGLFPIVWIVINTTFARHKSL